MTAPLSALRWSGLVPCGHSNDKTENHPSARKGDRLRKPDTDTYESFPKLMVVVKVVASYVLCLKETPFNTTFTFEHLQTGNTVVTPSTAFRLMLREICGICGCSHGCLFYTR